MEFENMDAFETILTIEEVEKQIKECEKHLENCDNFLNFMGELRTILKHDPIFVEFEKNVILLKPTNGKEVKYSERLANKTKQIIRDKYLHDMKNDIEKLITEFHNYSNSEKDWLRMAIYTLNTKRLKIIKSTIEGRIESLQESKKYIENHKDVPYYI